MDTYKEFDEYFICSYFNEEGQKVGVFKKGTLERILNQVEFDIIEFERGGTKDCILKKM